MTGRGLLTEREREVLAEEEGGSYQYKTRSVVRDRIDELEADAEVLAEAEPELYALLVEAVRTGGSADMGPGGDPNGPADPHPSTPEEPPAEPDRDPIRETVGDLELEGGSTEVSARREALVEVLEYLREEGSATPSELKAIVDDEDDRLYTDADSFWRNMSRQTVFEDLDVVGKPGKGGKRYYWEG
ncbi:hypothetical protein EKH57_00035 (plasmid) [Halorubrum sp. BOL3-1]|uniref:hypothetical protein n=1 Tax=Halorubrum sp. BOL3-1 TaxID=2497325 RepID=UPI001004F4C4|nr:hypothetical protein [Halorubrum sp. BOL3-1]QAU11322.1 hypothetical protein EKH57_00035 [Halorubrum sp. BOL3-1]